ncbi:uncharacterized protein EI90DRAFT_2932173, partial [Cantharellus anzutake]|uniref:uncharacterized protein n=1 Tax=Cantharellus anzutake TaxID=1750568 RepID=UPI00190689A3
PHRVPVAMTCSEKGWIGWSGGVNAEEGSAYVLLAMLGGQPSFCPGCRACDKSPTYGGCRRPSRSCWGIRGSNLSNIATFWCTVNDTSIRRGKYFIFIDKRK